MKFLADAMLFFTKNMDNEIKNLNKNFVIGLKVKKIYANLNKLNHLEKDLSINQSFSYVNTYNILYL